MTPFIAHVLHPQYPQLTGLALMIAAAAGLWRMRHFGVDLAVGAVCMVASAWPTSSPRPALTPGRPEPIAPEQPSAPVEHVGATEEYAVELREHQQTMPSDDLRTPAEQMLIDHDDLSGVDVAITEFSTRMDSLLRKFLAPAEATDQLRVARWGASSIDDTGTFDRRALEAMLADQPALTDVELAQAVLEEAGVR